MNQLAKISPFKVFIDSIIDAIKSLLRQIKIEGTINIKIPGHPPKVKKVKRVMRAKRV